MSEKRKQLPVVKLKGQSEAEAVAVAAVSPAINAALVADAYHGNVLGDDGDLGALVAILQASMKKANAGDLADLEGMLVGQAAALQAIFVSLARRAQVQPLQKHFEAFLGLALKAQAQSRATISALVDLKYPRQATFVKQANIANGPQQVNNGTAIPAHAEDQSGEQNELLEVQHGQPNGWVDTREAQAPERSNQAMEAVGAIHRAKDTGRKSRGIR
jgi:hypothetical protein